MPSSTSPPSPPQRRRSTAGLVASVITRVLVSGVVLAIGVGISMLLFATRPELVPEPPGDDSLSLPAFLPQVVGVQRQWTGFGTADAMDRADVPARVASTVVELPATSVAGAPVRRGELIVRLDDSDFRRQLEVAENTIAELDAQIARLEIERSAWAERVRLAGDELRLARADAERVRSARDDGAAQEREYDQATQRVIAAERLEIAAREELEKVPSRALGLKAQRDGQDSARRLAELAVDRCRIESPLDGVLQSVAVKVGESVQPGQLVARVVNLDRIEIPLQLPASARRHVDLGDLVRLFDDRAGTNRFDAVVTRIAPEDDAMTRTVSVFAELVRTEHGAAGLAPGRFVEAIVISGEPVQRMLLPRRSVRGDRVGVIVDGRIERREVVPEFVVEGSFPEFGLEDSAWVALATPLEPGAYVILDGSRTLAPGASAIPSLSAPGHSAPALAAPATERLDLPADPAPAVSIVPAGGVRGVAR